MPHRRYRDDHALVHRMRQQFLEKLFRLRPTTLEDLRALTPDYRRVRSQMLFETPAGCSIRCKAGWFESAFPESGDAQDLLAKIRAWAEKHRLRIGWILDTALNCLELWFSGAPDKLIIIPPPDLRNRAESEAPFSFTALVQHSCFQSLGEYRAEVIREFDKALSAHMAAIKTGTDLLPPDLERDVDWTARRFAGATPKQIAAEEGVDLRTVTRATLRVAVLIEIPTPGRGRPHD